ncbi:MAG: hypothetical protein IIB31_08450, partial [Chloroflexi bacterium]|nr:hypothetical protein [Chloroflexota bacterium]
AFAAGDLWLSHRQKAAHGGAAAPGQVRRLVRLVSQNSLILYVVHLWVLYGSQFGSARTSMLRSLDLVQGSALVLGLLTALVLMLHVWRFVERNWERQFLVVRRGTVATMAVAVIFCMVQVSGLQPVEPVAQATAAELEAQKAQAAAGCGQSGLLGDEPRTTGGGAGKDTARRYRWLAG